LRTGGVPIGLLLLVMGWLLVLAALVLLPALASRYAFVLAGLAVELLGLGLFAVSYKAPAKAKPSLLQRERA
jgi:hypothetical protein